MKKKIYVTSLIFFLIDFLSKLLVICFDSKFPVVVIKDFFVLDKVTNEGAAFSFFSGYVFVLVLISILILYYVNKSIINDIRSKTGILGVSMLIGGILGNLFDRVFYGKVIDFLSFNIFGYMFPVFNLADTFICVGVGLLIIEFLRGDINGNKGK